MHVTFFSHLNVFTINKKLNCFGSNEAARRTTRNVLNFKHKNEKRKLKKTNRLNYIVSFQKTAPLRAIETTATHSARFSLALSIKRKGRK